MRKRLHLEGKAPVHIAVDLSRSKWVYYVRWDGAERLRLSTAGEIKHLQALAERACASPKRFRRRC